MGLASFVFLNQWIKLKKKETFSVKQFKNLPKE